MTPSGGAHVVETADRILLRCKRCCPICSKNEKAAAVKEAPPRPAGRPTASVARDTMKPARRAKADIERLKVNLPIDRK